MSQLKVDEILDSSGGSTAQINGATPTVYNTMGRNRIINGDMRIDQRNAGASVTPSNAYTLDRWKAITSQASKYSVQQNAGSVTSATGFSNYLGVTSSSAYSILTGDYFFLQHNIEGFNISDFAWGTANAATVTLSFKVYSSLTGTFGGSITNAPQNRSYPFTYTVSSANTWTTISVTIAGDTSGTWATDNTLGISVCFGLGVGGTYSGTAGAWAGAAYYSSTGATSVVGTNGATFYITGVQLEVGSVATEFERRPYGTELQLCQRYYQQYSNTERLPVWVASNNAAYVFSANVLMTPMRATPTVSLSGAATFDSYYRGTVTQSSASIGRNTGSQFSVILAYGNFSGLTQGDCGVIENTTTSISAEL